MLIPVNKRYRTTIDYWFYRLIYKTQQYNNDVALEKERMRKKVAVQMND